MRVSVIADDNIIIVDGEAREIPGGIVIDENIWAIQWDDAEGEIEHREGAVDASGDPLPRNEHIAEQAVIDPFVQQWTDNPPPPPPDPIEVV